MINRDEDEDHLLLSFKATDQTGFGYADFNFKRIEEDGSFDSDNNESIWINDWNSLTIGGSQNDGTFVGLLQLSSDSQEGKYELESFYISDEADNDKYYSVNTSTVNNVITKSCEKEAKEALGGYDPTKLSFSIIGEKIVDHDKSIPELKNVSLKKPFIDSKSELHEFRSGQASFVVVEINDAQGDLTGEFPFTNGSGGYQTIGELEFLSPSGQQRIEVDIKTSHLIDGDSYSGKYKIPIFLNESHESGIWSLVDLDVTDDADNELEIGRNDNWGRALDNAERSHMAERLGVHPNSISFNYENKNYKSNSDDKKPPLLKDFVVSEVGKNEMLVTLKIDDSQSGVIS